MVIKIGVFLWFCLICLVAPARSSQTLPAPSPGTPGAGFTLNLLEGRHLSLSGLRGKVVVLYFWASWCPPCRAETPHLIRVAKRLRGHGAVVIGVNEGEPASVVRSYAAQKSIPFFVATDLLRDTGKSYGVSGIPVLYVIDATGIVRARFLGQLSEGQLLSFVADASHHRNGGLSNPVQKRIDAILAPAQYGFGTSRHAVLRAVATVQQAIDETNSFFGSPESGRVPEPGKETDAVRTNLAQAVLLDRAVAALRPIASSNDERVLLFTLEGDSSTDRELWGKASTWYGQALKIRPTDERALNGLAVAERSQFHWRNAADDFAKLVSEHPSTYAFIELSKAALESQQDARAVGAAQQAITFADKQLARPRGKTPLAQGWVAYAHLNLAKAFATAHNIPKAESEYRKVMQLALLIPARSQWFAFYVEQANEGLLALRLGKATSSLTIAPWTGPDLPGSISSTLKYRLALAGKPKKQINVEVTRLPQGWLASLCTDGICSIMKRTLEMPASGIKIVELQLIHNTGSSAAPLQGIVTLSDGSFRTSERIPASPNK